jgi:uncharacterized protein DUF2330
MQLRFLDKFTVLGSLLGAVTLSLAPSASACGGFFCSQQQPVNQSAERIIFADNGDGTITAVIQIQYEGPSENFSWVLPVSTVLEQGQLAVASDLAFTRLQAATNPQFNLATVVEGTCRSNNFDNGDSVAAPSAQSCSDNPLLAQCDRGTADVVDVDASGVVGPFEYTVISVEPGVADPAAPAREWLTANGYDVTPEGAALLGPYLADGMHLLALRLTKGSDVGSIRPIQITYPASAPMIPIKLTAVAANQDMGVMTWTLGASRSVPFNYNALELNEARINWFNAASTYGQVVNEAADAAGGQGFVTEFAGPSAQLADVVWPSSEELDWQGVKSAVYSSFNDLFQVVYERYQGYSGFWDAVKPSVTLPDDVSFEDFKLCPRCYAEDLEFRPTTLFDALEAGVIEPLREIQRMIDRAPYATRLYSTLSAAEMTVDPVFVFNADLPDVNNVHTAKRVTECNPNIYEYQANWRIEFPQGGVLRGTPDDIGQWPASVTEQPANYQVLVLAKSGEGEVVADNAEAIDGWLTTYNAIVPSPASSAMAGSQGGMCALGSQAARPGTRVPLATTLFTLLGACWLRRRKAGAQARSRLGA